MNVLSYGFIPNEATIIPRWQVQGYPLLVGGPVTSEADWRHLEALGVGHVVCVTDPADVGVPIRAYTHAAVEDNGNPFSFEKLATVTDAAHRAFCAGKWVYLHCWMGASRSPSFAYAVLRKVFSLSRADAHAVITSSCPWPWPRSQTQSNYIDSIESWMAKPFG